MTPDTVNIYVLEISKRIISAILVNEKVATVKFANLDTDGHFTSTVKALKVDVVDIPNPGNKRTIKLVAKVLENRKNDYLKLAFRKEDEFYRSLIPVYNTISLSKDIEASITPHYFGSNILSNKDDEPGLILLENLEYSGYQVYPERYFDLNHTKLIIDKMSYFHALGIALKMKNSKAFKEDFKNLIEPALLNSSSVNRSSINLKLRTEIQSLLQKYPEMKKFTKRVDALLEKIDNMRLPQPKEPFCTLIHNDLWKNNILLKYSNNTNEIIDIKFIDFQFVIYNSPIRDLAYFVFSSCSLEIQKDFRRISMFYYECFVKNLQKLKCDTSEFTESRFIEEVNEYAPTKFKHLVLLMKKTPGLFEESLRNLVLSHAESGLL